MSNIEVAGTGPAVVLLHAFPVNRHLWDDVIPPLADAGFRVVALDYAGFGQSPVPTAPPSVDAMAADILARVQALGITEFCLAGLSMGGYAAMEILRQAPERVTALGLLDTKMAADGDEARDRRLAVADRVIAEASTTFLVEAMLPQLVGAGTLAGDSAVTGIVTGWIESAPPEAVAWAQRAMAGRPDSTSDLARYPGPALVLAGSDDVISPPEEQQRIAATLPDADLVIVPGVGHLSAVEQPAPVASALIELARRSIPA